MRLKYAVVCAAAAVSLPMTATATDIYGYVDADGVAHYSNIPDSSRYKLVLRNADDYKLRLGNGGDGQRDYSNPQQAPHSATGNPLSEFDARQPFAEIIRREAVSLNLDPFLVAAVISIESNHNPAARSPKGAMGLMQLMPDTAKRYGAGDPFHAESNIRAGMRYLHDLLKLFNGDVSLALAAYNAGENAVIRYGNRIPPYPETLDYVPKVLKKYQTLRKII